MVNVLDNEDLYSHFYLLDAAAKINNIKSIFLFLIWIYANYA